MVVAVVLILGLNDFEKYRIAIFMTDPIVIGIRCALLFLKPRFSPQSTF